MNLGGFMGGFLGIILSYFVIDCKYFTKCFLITLIITYFLFSLYIYSTFFPLTTPLKFKLTLHLMEKTLII